MVGISLCEAVSQLIMNFNNAFFELGIQLRLLTLIITLLLTPKCMKKTFAGHFSTWERKLTYNKVQLDFKLWGVVFVIHICL